MPAGAVLLAGGCCSLHRAAGARRGARPGRLAGRVAAGLAPLDGSQLLTEFDSAGWFENEAQNPKTAEGLLDAFLSSNVDAASADSASSLVSSASDGYSGLSDGAGAAAGAFMTGASAAEEQGIAAAERGVDMMEKEGLTVLDWVARLFGSDDFTALMSDPVKATIVLGIFFYSFLTPGALRGGRGGSGGDRAAARGTGAASKLCGLSRVGPPRLSAPIHRWHALLRRILLLRRLASAAAAHNPL